MHGPMLPKLEEVSLPPSHSNLTHGAGARLEVFSFPRALGRSGESPFGALGATTPERSAELRGFSSLTAPLFAISGEMSGILMDWSIGGSLWLTKR